MRARTRRALRAAAFAASVVALGTSTTAVARTAPVEIPNVPMPEALSEFGVEAPARLCGVTTRSGVPCAEGTVGGHAPDSADSDVVYPPRRVVSPLREPGEVLNGPGAQQAALDLTREVQGLREHTEFHPTVVTDLDNPESDDPESEGELTDFRVRNRCSGNDVSGVDDVIAAHGYNASINAAPTYTAGMLAHNVTGLDREAVDPRVGGVRAIGHVMPGARGVDARSARSDLTPGFGLGPLDKLLSGIDRDRLNLGEVSSR